MYRCMGRGGRETKVERQKLEERERKREVSKDRDRNYVNVYWMRVRIKDGKQENF